MTYYRFKAWRKVTELRCYPTMRMFEFCSKAAANQMRKELKAQGYETSEVEKVKE